MTAKKPRAKKPAATNVAPAGETFEALMIQTVKDKADADERVTQSHLTRRAWQLYGNLIYFGVIEPPDRHIADVVGDEKPALVEMAERIMDDIVGIVLSFNNMAIGPHGDEEF